MRQENEIRQKLEEIRVARIKSVNEGYVPMIADAKISMLEFCLGMRE